MAKVGPDQDPFLRAVLGGHAVDRTALDRALETRAAGRGFDRALILFGGDHGFWREERLLCAAGRWWLEIDSHRNTRRSMPPIDQGAAERLFADAERIARAHAGTGAFVDDGGRAFLHTPMLVWASACGTIGIVRGFGLAACLRRACGLSRGLGDDA